MGKPKRRQQNIFNVCIDGYAYQIKGPDEWNIVDRNKWVKRDSNSNCPLKHIS